YTIINRGFGGSALTDLIGYADDIIFPYQPKQIVIYCGENDFASSDTISSNTVYQRFKTLFSIIRNKFPKVSVAYVSMKPSPIRRHLMSKMVLANNMIKGYLTSKKSTYFIDVFPEMLDKNGNPINNIFLQDSLHMNADGYKIWQRIIQPYLLK
ncbi:MAG: GDSL-type esterase/lipase family protein, partial [Ginsengibacter sp.]